MSDPVRLFWWGFASTLLLKLALAAWLPLTGDEVYFYLWGRYPDYGFYDHPPLVGWVLTLLMQVSDAQWWLRLPAVLLGSLIGLSLYRVSKVRLGRERAALLGLAYLLAPMSLVAVLITTDTLLILFGFLSALALWRALQQGTGGYRWFLLSGMMLGLAFLSKYFAVLLGLVYGVYLLLVRPGRRNALGLLLILLAVLPFAAVNIVWNYQHCWNNILFNIFNRHSEPMTWQGPLLYLVTLSYLLTPVLLWYGWRRRCQWLKSVRDGELFGWLWLLPLGLFLLLSWKAKIGLHWLLTFYPFVFFSLVALFDTQQLRRTATFMGLFSALHLLAVVVVLVLPVEQWKSRPGLQYDLMLGMHAGELWQELEPLVGERLLATTSYTKSAVLEYGSKQRVAVFGSGSKYARQDDILTDYRQVESVALVLEHEHQLDEYRVFFRDTTTYRVVLHGVSVHLLLGDGLLYERYRSQVLEPIRQRYYRLPQWLPVGGCYFYRRYFPQQQMEHLP
ncbi:MAG: glycosyltransferase family 39 protein [Pseudomonadota bacterium]